MLDEKKKPEIITYYNETKSGVDVSDKLVRTYSCKRASSRWTVAFFLNMLDIAEYNAFVRWITFDPNWQQGKPHRRRLFLHELATQLLHGHASARFRTPKFLEVTKRRRIQKCARRLGIITAATGMSSSLGSVTDSNTENRRRRCHMRPRKKDGKTREYATHVECRFASSTAV